MSEFLTDDRLNIQPMQREDGTWVWVTSRAFGFRFGSYGDYGCIFTVPMGFETDLGSIPWWCRWLLNPSDPSCSTAYVIHDYVNSITKRRRPGIGVVSSHMAASVLYDALRLCGVSPFKAGTIYSGVVAGIAKDEL